MSQIKPFLVFRAYVMFALLFFFITSNAAVPNAINYQGYLTDVSDQPINATQSMTFRIYSQTNGGIELWSETQSVVIEQGAFATVLGDNLSPFPNGLFDGPLYLGISVNGDGEMSPRSPLTSAPFALNAERLDGQTAADIAYTDAQARAAMGARNNNNPLNHNRFTNANAVAAMGSRNNNNPLNHNRYTNSEAVSAMGALNDNNPLNHNRFTNANAVAAIQAADGAGSNIDADLLDGMQASEIIAAASAPQGTPITSLPITITAPGDYYLANDVSSATSFPLRVFVSGVNLNLNGKTITSTSASTSTTASIISAANAGDDSLRIFNGIIQGPVGSESLFAIRLGSSTNVVIDNVRFLDTRGIELFGQNCAARITNNYVNGDTSLSSLTGTPTVPSEGINASSCSASLIKNNTVINSFSTANSEGGILSRESVVEGNTVRNILNQNGACVFAITSGVLAMNATSRCSATGTEGPNVTGNTSNTEAVVIINNSSI